VVIASSATRFQIAPVARDLGIDTILCSELAVADGTVLPRSPTPTAVPSNATFSA